MNLSLDSHARWILQYKGSLGLTLCLFLFLFPGCEKEVPRNDYFPLRDGNRWEYRLLDTPLLKRMAKGQLIVTAEKDAAPHEDEKRPDDAPPKAEVVDNAFKDPDNPGSANQKAAQSTAPVVARRVVLELLAAVDDITYKALYDTSEQVWSARNGYVSFQSSRGRSYLLILPPHTGYRWVVTGPAGQDLYYEIESAAASVSTPAGPFHDCVVARQESRDRKEIFRYWFAPDVGLVRRSKYFLNEEVFRQELVEYNVKPATPTTRAAEEKEVKKAMEGKNRGSEFRERSKDALERGGDSEPGEQDEKIQKFGNPR